MRISTPRNLEISGNDRASRCRPDRPRRTVVAPDPSISAGEAVAPLIVGGGELTAPWGMRRIRNSEKRRDPSGDLMLDAITLSFASTISLLPAAQNGGAPAGRPLDPPNQVTAPLKVEGNRPLVELTLLRADGTTRKATFLVDSGGGGFVM